MTNQIKEYLKKINISKVIRFYLVIYCLIMVLYSATNGPLAWGEPDDYTLPVASILNDQNFSINDSDIEYYNELFPDLVSDIQNCYSLSGYMSRDGKGELTWYFPTYALLNIPLVILFSLFNIKTLHAFSMTNIALMMVLLYTIYKCLKASDVRKLAAVLVFSINPIVFYFPWISGETMIFVFVGLAMICWYNGWYKRSALFLGIAGTLNVTALATGFFMIAEYLSKMLKSKTEAESIGGLVKRNIKDLVCYGLCYVPGIIPMLYNYYNIGAINLTASYSSFTNGRESTLQRFRSYFVDLNYGYIPYYGILLVVAIVLVFFAMYKKHWRFLLQIGAFLLTVFCYSVMVHINCGGSGIARYSSWGAVILFTAIIFYYDQILDGSVLKRICGSLIALNTAVVFVILNWYGPYGSSNTWGMGWTPISRYVMDNLPAIYNPLGSSFYSHMNNAIGGYEYETPLVYVDESGEVRKILATSDDIQDLQEEYCGVTAEDQEWFIKQLEKLKEKEQYISVSKNRSIIRCSTYEVGDTISFVAMNNTAQKYCTSGLYEPEEWGSWSDGNTVSFTMKISDVDVETLHCHVTCGSYDNYQTVLVYVNDEFVYQGAVIENSGFDFDFQNVPDTITKITFELPDATPNPTDGRTIGLSFGQMVIERQ